MIAPLLKFEPIHNLCLKTQKRLFFYIVAKHIRKTRLFLFCNAVLFACVAPTKGYKVFVKHPGFMLSGGEKNGPAGPFV